MATLGSPPRNSNSFFLCQSALLHRVLLLYASQRQILPLSNFSFFTNRILINFKYLKLSNSFSFLQILNTMSNLLKIISSICQLIYYLSHQNFINEFCMYFDLLMSVKNLRKKPSKFFTYKLFSR